MFSNVKNKLDTTQNKGLLLILGIILILVVIIMIILLSGLRGYNANQTPIPTPTTLPGGKSTQHKINPAQKTIIEQTTQKEVESLPEIKEKSILSNGSTRYTLTSPFISRKNEVIVKDNLVIYERLLKPKSTTGKKYAQISDYEKEYGHPQKIIRGSLFYGNLIRTYIYADRGFALIGNPFTNEVLEIHIFTPTTVENYIKQYGEDINKNAPDGEY